MQKIASVLDVKCPANIHCELELEDPEQPYQSDDVCSVCLDELKLTCVRKLPCNHVLHQGCLDRWCKHLGNESSWACPLCRHPLISQESNRNQEEEKA